MDELADLRKLIDETTRFLTQHPHEVNVRRAVARLREAAGLDKL